MQEVLNSLKTPSKPPSGKVYSVTTPVPLALLRPPSSLRSSPPPIIVRPAARRTTTSIVCCTRSRNATRHRRRPWQLIRRRATMHYWRWRRNATWRNIMSSAFFERSGPWARHHFGSLGPLARLDTPPPISLVRAASAAA